METILTHAIIASATDTVDAYVATINGLNEELSSAISSLTGSGFMGDASNGYTAFYSQKVVPALTDNLTAPADSLMASIKTILQSIETQLLDTLDPQMGENNSDPGAAQ